MYFSIGIVIFLLLLFIVLGSCHRRNAARKVCSMSPIEKCKLLSTIIAPFGYCYDNMQDIISSRSDAWQREAGYTPLFDHAAASFHMVFDSLPVYFPYRDRTWLIEFWKGQYGINTGGEIGIYYADRILTNDELSTAHFHAVDDDDMLPLSFILSKEDISIAKVSRYTWWLTSFCVGLFSSPSQLSMYCAIHFPDYEMLYSFLDSLYKTGISKKCICTCATEMHIKFTAPPKCTCGFFTRLRRKWAQFTNRIFCHIYRVITSPFCLTIDRLLYLYYILPFAFRRTLTPRGYYKYKRSHH